MSFSLEAIEAETHTPEYSMHKYWARKPHNVISSFLSALVPINGHILDPFCGSGVVLHEARKLGMRATGFDVNPIANLITSVLINPPETRSFEKEFLRILDKLDAKISPLYCYKDESIRYLVHEMIVKCSTCNKPIKFSEAMISGKSKRCPHCDKNLNFNLENLIDTQIKRFITTSSKEFICDETAIKEQSVLSKTYSFGFSKAYNYRFSQNKRILAYEGMETKDLFTPRNYSVLCFIADELSLIKDERIRKAAQLLLSASIAQCSRLIPNRNDQSTGGPAWSVPGFWVPAEHLETNPIVHIKARFKKFVRALEQINSKNYPESATIRKTNAIQGLKDFRKKGLFADLVFFDPPYGDSVPYLEFSSIWNSFLMDFPSFDEDISVSDRLSKSESWKRYNTSLAQILKEIKSTLSTNGKILITFNNNDLNAWEALLKGLQDNHFFCDFVTYQIPAVISAKAQLSLDGSYISDFYSVYSLQPKRDFSLDLTPISNKLKKAAIVRKGTIARNLANRIIILEMLRNNILADLLKEKDSILKNLFDEKNGILIFKKNLPNNEESLESRSLKAAKKILSNGPCDWNKLYKKIALQFEEYGFIDPTELKGYLEAHIVMEKKRCISYLD